MGRGRWAKVWVCGAVAWLGGSVFSEFDVLARFHAPIDVVDVATSHPSECITETEFPATRDVFEFSSIRELQPLLNGRLSFWTAHPVTLTVTELCPLL